METFRILILGDGAVGKSVLTIRFLENRFVENDPQMEQEDTTQVTVDNSPCTLQIKIPMGQEEYRALLDGYIRVAEGFLCVYSVDSKSSFDIAENLMELIERVKDGKVPMVLIGNKCDLEEKRQINSKQGIELAKKFQCPFYETSALIPLRVEDAFHQLVREMRSFGRISNHPQDKHCEIM
jgi:GTPase KRas